MKRIFSFLLILFTSLLSFGKPIVINNIKYTLHNNQTISCSSANKSDITDIIIPSSINIDGFQYYVTSIDKAGFMGCKNLRSIILPNSIQEIGERAFWNCKNLEKVIMPDEAKVNIYPGSYGYGMAGIFKGCEKLSDVRGQTILYPKYVLYDAFMECKETPFYAIMQEKGAANMVEMQMKRNFSDFAIDLSKKNIEEWQKRKNYETISQWESRVNDENRRKIIEEAALQAHKEYLKLYSPASISGTLEDYNEEYEFFPVNLDNWGTAYIQVQKNKSQFFENSWNEAKIIPKFGVVDDELTVLSCAVTLNGETYNPVREYEEDDLTLFAQRITPLASLKEYEQMMASSNNDNQTTRKVITPDIIDIEIPETKEINSNTFVVIIGNEDYQRVAPVEYAMNDARILEKYCNRTLGIPTNNIRTYYNATYGDIVAAIEDLSNISDAFNGNINIIFYYAGHGLPDESNRKAYLLPIDASGTQLEVCYPLEKLYSQLGELKTNSVIVFLDACFSGSLRGEGMLASTRGIKLKPKDIDATGNMIVVSAASSDQSAYPYHEKNHGLFTYFLLKKLNDSKGDVNIGELADYITSEVAKISIVENKKPQYPNIKYSPNMAESWKEITLK